MKDLEKHRSTRRAPAVAVVCALVVCGALGVLVPVQAHHSLSGVYDSSVQVAVEGVVSQFQFINPHPFVVVVVTSDQGRKEEWRLELDNRFELEAIGVTARTFQKGDRIVASGSRGRTQLTSLYVRRLDRPSDGFWYEQVGSTPKIR